MRIQTSRTAVVLMLVLAVVAAPATAQDGATRHSHGSAAAAQTTPAQASVPLYDDLGEHHYEISTAVPLAQAYFDQGLRLYYAFNHPEAIRSFQQAQTLDEQCAMCWWGEALAWGPNINLPMDEPSAQAAHTALQQAIARREHAGPRERELIDALATRYAAVLPEDRAHLDAAYSEAMLELDARYPEDDEIAVLAAESVMDLQPWDYWDEAGQPRPGMGAALESLMHVVERSPEHPGACHFYIHAVEKLYPERAIPCAERLAGLMPGAGHLVHMPGHIYIRVGRYQDAIDLNRHAVHADETFIRDVRPGMTNYTAGYYPHNYDFLAFAALMLGDEAQAMEAASQVEALVPEEMMDAPGMGFLQHWAGRPVLVGVRFERWEELLERPAPPAGRPHSRALWHYGRGRALAASGEVASARAELASLRAIAGSDELEGFKMEFNQSSDLLAIASHVLAGWVDAASNDHAAAVRHLRAAVELEDALLYGEPPEWTVPVRQDLGAVLLLAGDRDGAGAAFREDLERFPGNHWSERGLARARREN